MKKEIKKAHTFHIGDLVNFTVQLSGRGDKMIATNIQYLYNTALNVLLNKAKTENSFIGYLKMADDKIFVKENMQDSNTTKYQSDHFNLFPAYRKNISKKHFLDIRIAVRSFRNKHNGCG